MMNEQKGLMVKVNRCQTQGFISHVINLTKSDPSIVIKRSMLDSDSMLFNFRNGTLNLQTFELQAHCPQDMLTKKANVDYDPDATCPNFDKFLAEILDKETGEFILRALGYSLLGDPTEQRLFIAYGPGCNGKSTFFNVFLKIIGSYAATADPSTFAKSNTSPIRNDLARLEGARVCMTTEFPPGCILDAPLIKRISGGDTITARSLYKENIEFTPKFVPFVVSNYLPVIDGGDKALARRFVAIPFLNVIPQEEIDKHLEQKLMGEASGILNRLIDGLRDYQQNGLLIPASILIATEEYVGESNLIGKFCQEVIEKTPGKKARAGDVFSAYQLWCGHNGYRPFSAAIFKRAFEQELNIKPGRDASGAFWPGIFLPPGWVARAVG